MTFDTALFSTLRGLVNDRVYPDFAPEKMPTPYITYQQVGGEAVNFLTQEDPCKGNARMQVNVWAASRIDASSLALQVEQAMRANTSLQTTVLGAAVSTSEPDLGLRGMRQDFSIWV